MSGSDHNQLKPHVKTNPIFLLLLLPLLASACASLTGADKKTVEAPPRTLQSAAQENWEKGGIQGSAEYHFALAQAYSNDGKVDRAIEEFRAALAHDPDSAILHAKLAAEYLKKGSVTFAIDECLKSLSHDPSSIEVHLMLGGIYSLNNEFDLALNEYEGVLKVDPENDEAAVFKTQVLGEKEQYAEALAFIRKFTSKVTDSAAAWFYLGKLEHHQDHVNEAIRAYRKAIEVRPGFSQASLSLGLIFELNRENKKALEVYEAQMEEKPDLQIAARLVTLYLRDNRNDPALKLLKTMAALDPEDLNTRLRIGLIHLHSGALGEAKGVFEELLKKIPDSDKVHYYLAATLEQEGRWEQAVEHLSKVSADSRLFEDSNLHAAGLYRDRKRIEDAFGVIRSAIQRSPENAGFYIFQASMFEDQKKWKEASGSLADGLKLFPDHHRMRYFYGAILEKLGNTDEAIAQMEKILEAKPDHADALNFVGYTWTVQGVRLKDAEELLKRAIKLKPDNPFILDSYGWNQFMLGKNANALIYLEKAAGLKGDEESILQHLVEVYAKNQMPERARETRGRIQSLQLEAERTPASVEQK